MKIKRLVIRVNKDYDWRNKQLQCLFIEIVLWICDSETEMELGRDYRVKWRGKLGIKWGEEKKRKKANNISVINGWGLNEYISSTTALGFCIDAM